LQQKATDKNRRLSPCSTKTIKAEMENDLIGKHEKQFRTTVTEFYRLIPIGDVPISQEIFRKSSATVSMVMVMVMVYCFI